MRTYLVPTSLTHIAYIGWWAPHPGDRLRLWVRPDGRVLQLECIRHLPEPHHGQGLGNAGCQSSSLTRCDPEGLVWLTWDASVKKQRLVSPSEASIWHTQPAGYITATYVMP